MASKVAFFVQKLYLILEDPANAQTIHWNHDEFIITHPTLLADTILPLHFRHSKLESFIRQLNLYGFRKIKRSEEKEALYFKHDLFRQGCTDLLPRITLKHKNKSQDPLSRITDSKEINRIRNEELSSLRFNFKAVIQSVFNQLNTPNSSRDSKIEETLSLLRMCGARKEES